MKKIIFSLFGLLFFGGYSAMASERVFSECRFDESSLEILGLAISRYKSLRGKATMERFFGGYIFLWKKTGDTEALVDQKLSDNAAIFKSAHKFLMENVEQALAYALVWEDYSLGTKYGELATTIRVNAGFNKGLGYEVLFNAKDINAEGVEIGCSINLLEW